jgi:predicted amidohydrolase YtcJ
MCQLIIIRCTSILGNIITMNEKRPSAKAVLVGDGFFAYIGEEVYKA